jgi:hypothetical protein
MEVIGYTLTTSRKREFKVEQWVYGPRAKYYHVLTFTGGRLSKIEKVRQN